MILPYGRWVLVLALLVGLPGVGETLAAERKVTVELIAPVTSIRPGVAFTVGLKQTIAPRWHTYWKNPGDSGEPTQINWKLPEGFEASDITWPLPSALPIGPLMNHGYSGEVVLPVTITPPTTIKDDRIELKATADWLVCKDICIPERQDVSLQLNVTRAEGPLPLSRHNASFVELKRRLPVDLGWSARAEIEGNHYTLLIQTNKVDPERYDDIHFFADRWGMISPSAAQKAGWIGDQITLTLERGELPPDDPPRLTGVLVMTEKRDAQPVRLGVEIDTADHLSAVSGVRGTDAVNSPPTAVRELPKGIGFLQAVLLAFLGGLILNLMPCVLPVLSLKVMTLAGHGGNDASAVRGGLAYFGGVMISFTLLAALLAMMQALGENLGWGFQFQSPGFVLLLAAIFFTLGLSLSGVFDIGVGIIGVGDKLRRRGGILGSFSTGVLASIAATPCTAPFMGAAIGYALTQSTTVLIAVMLALGFGFALPVTALSLNSSLGRLLPNPGPWMETLKQVLAFPRDLVSSSAPPPSTCPCNPGADEMMLSQITPSAVVAFCSFCIFSVR